MSFTTPQPFITIQQPLSYKNAFIYLANYQQYHHIVKPAVKPQGGDVFLYALDELTKDDWRCDCYRWTINNG